MRSGILLFFVLFLCFNANAQYSTPNTGVSWTLDDVAAASPATVTVSGDVYTLHEDLTVEENDELLLNSDLRLEIVADVEINVKGIFKSDSDQVTITAVDPELPYKGFWFYDESEGYFNHTKVEYGGGIRVVTANFTMENSEMSNNNNESGSSTGAAISFSKGSPVINNCIFKDNYNPALSSAANASAAIKIYDSYFEGNNWRNNNRPQINMGPSGPNDSIIIVGNTIIGDRNFDKVGGLSVSSLIGVENRFRVEDNVIRDNRYGITSAGTSSGYIVNNILEDNDTETNPMNGGSGISLYSTDLVYVTGNEIRRNLWGITLIDTAVANLGNDDPDNYNPGENIFSDNGNGGVIYALYNNTPNEVWAINNCWIEGQESTIEDVEEVIVHKNDDNTLGEVFFDPFLCGEEEMGVIDLNSTAFSMYPNPAHEQLSIVASEVGKVMIFDVNGRLMHSTEVTEGENRIRLNLGKGVYMVRFDGKELKASRKLIVN